VGFFYQHQETDMQLEQARWIALAKLADLAPFTVRREIAGSVRRCKPDVHDIEILCIAKTAPITDMFGAVTGQASALEENMDALVKGWNAKYKRNGPQWKTIILPDGINLDIFISTSETWGVEYVIRTGNKDFSKKCVTVRRAGGFLPSDCKVEDGWRVKRNGKTISLPEEIDFLNFLGLGWIEPQARV
jgi:DNA polymerase/3'-5' exonuclease PolX